MKNKFLCNLIFLSILSIFITSCLKAAEKASVIEKTEEGVFDTGVLDIISSPSSAEIYVNGELKGNTPLTLYNFPVGTYKLVVKKDDYTDFEKEVIVKVGRTEEVEAELIPIKNVEIAEEKTTDAIADESSIPTIEQNKINLSSFAMYYDFDKILFTELRTEGSDLFSRKYDEYVDFTVITPAKIGLLNKQINDVEKEDCNAANEAIAQFYSGQTLCIKTGEGSVFAVGGNWEKMPQDLEWKLLS